MLFNPKRFHQLKRTLPPWLKLRRVSATSSEATWQICAVREACLAPPIRHSNNISSLIERLAGPSLTEIGSLISELESMREMLHAEGQRVQREISGYGQLSQAAMKSTRMIADSVSEWKRAADGLRNG